MSVLFRVKFNIALVELTFDILLLGIEYSIISLPEPIHQDNVSSRRIAESLKLVELD